MGLFSALRTQGQRQVCARDFALGRSILGAPSRQRPCAWLSILGAPRRAAFGPGQLASSAREACNPSGPALLRSAAVRRPVPRFRWRWDGPQPNIKE